MPKNKIYVKALPGRVARVSPRGAMIPSDHFVAVDFTPYVKRLLEVHGDIELQPAPVKTDPKPNKAESAPSSKE
ncbi:MAG: hypothetical protein ACRCYS_07840 [Beijerinckiaceae bacterium]